MSIARTLPAVSSRRSARTGGQRKVKWGHRLSAMETANRLPRGRCTAGFNGGTAFRRWKLYREAAHIHLVNVLSMGPPPFGDGYMSPSRVNRWTSCSFNGATAFRRWIPRRGLDARVSPPCFNGATAFRRWIRCGIQPKLNRHHTASMGPPPFGDGYVAGSPAQSSVVTRCFNGATAFRRWIQPGPGPGPGVRFNGATAFRRWIRPTADSPACPVPASMGPPPFGDGYGAAHLGAAQGHPGASMGPPPFGDGYCPRRRWCGGCIPSFNGATAFRRWIPDDLARNGRGSGWLQWGHRLSAMDTIEHQRNLGDIDTLQWGHRLSAMDTRTCRTAVLGSRSSFNGATAFRRWIPDGSPVTDDHREMLQWGHRLSAMDTL